MTFTTSSDKIVRNKTIGVFILFSMPLFNLIRRSDGWISTVGFVAFFMLLLLFIYLRRPSKYVVDKTRIVIHRPIGNVEIGIQDIARVDRIHRDLLKNSVRGGAFGYFGKLDTDLGKATFYATRRDKLVMLTKYDKTKIILTPDQEDEFIDNVEKNIGSQQIFSR